MQINDDYYEDLEVADINSILDDFKAGKRPIPGELSDQGDDYGSSAQDPARDASRRSPTAV